MFLDSASYQLIEITKEEEVQLSKKSLEQFEQFEKDIIGLLNSLVGSGADPKQSVQKYFRFRGGKNMLNNNNQQ